MDVANGPACIVEPGGTTTDANGQVGQSTTDPESSVGGVVSYHVGWRTCCFCNSLVQGWDTMHVPSLT